MHSTRKPATPMNPTEGRAKEIVLAYERNRIRAEMGEEAVFLSDIKKQNQQIAFVPRVIASHPEISSTDKFDFAQRYYIQGAFLSRVLKVDYFMGLAAKLFFDLKQNKLKINQISAAIKNANRGKMDYCKLILVIDFGIVWQNQQV